MVLGMSLATFTLVHVVISLVGIASGLIVMWQLVRNRALGLSNTIFLVTTIATSVTGFLFPFNGVTPALAFGVISLVILAVALFALFAGNLIGRWRWIYVVTAAMALYLNVFVAVVQSFQKVGRLRALAPTQSEPPFALAQGAVLVLFVVIGIVAIRRFRPPTA
ncbi:hypothetical protein [Reyranella sp.]|jgi:hypothetical protein|uniref:hypothetical protein n=1 Tax=Reyranella sp. TaxID=1929291 RepID=UPI003D0F379E